MRPFETGHSILVIVVFASSEYILNGCFYTDLSETAIFRLLHYSLNNGGLTEIWP